MAIAAFPFNIAADTFCWHVIKATNFILKVKAFFSKSQQCFLKLPRHTQMSIVMNIQFLHYANSKSIYGGCAKNQIWESQLATFTKSDTLIYT